MADAPTLAAIGKRDGELELGWSDGASERVAAAVVRARCKCSQCQSIRIGTGADPVVDPAVQLLEVRPVGAYAVQMVFSDGHERGIFPYEYLATWTRSPAR